MVLKKVLEKIPHGELAKEAVKELSAVLWAAILQHGVSVEPLAPGAHPKARTSTHYGPKGHDADAGQPLWLGLHIEMKDKLPEALISCGELVGRRFPPPGPMGGVDVVWTGLDALRKHGTIGYVPAPGKGARPRTNKLGNAWVTLVPRDEDRPGKGEIEVARGEIVGAPLYLGGSGTISGELIQLGFGTKATLGWEVSWHACGGGKRGARAAQDAGSCESGPPRGYRASFSGSSAGPTSNYGYSFTRSETWSGTPRFKAATGEVEGEIEYRVVSGQVNWRTTISGECTAEASGNYPIDAPDDDPGWGALQFLDTYIHNGGYRIWNSWALHNTATEHPLKCQTPTGSTVISMPFAGPEGWIFSGNELGSVGQTLSGSFHYARPRVSWTLTPEW